MFGHGYFGGRYFGADYWGPGVVVVDNLIGKRRRRHKRWFEFENGIRVYATDEVSARIIANWSDDKPAPVIAPRKRPAAARKAVPAPVVAPDGRDAQARRARAGMREAEKALAASRASIALEEAALEAELAEMQRREEEEVIAILMLA